jgi:hypothetical protein
MASEAEYRSLQELKSAENSEKRKLKAEKKKQQKALKVAIEDEERRQQEQVRLDPGPEGVDSGPEGAESGLGQLKRGGRVLLGLRARISLNVPLTFPECSLNVPLMFFECSLTVR